MYIQDYDGRYPEIAEGAAIGMADYPDNPTGSEGETWGDGPPPSIQLIWSGMLMPYMKSTQVLFCPSATHKLITSYDHLPFDGMHMWRVNNHQLSLGMILEFEPWDDWGCVVDANACGLAGIHSEADYPYPAQTAAFTDSLPVDPSTGSISAGGGAGFVADPYWGIDFETGISDRHQSGTHIGFLDGHVKWYQAVTLVVADQVLASGQCINYDRAGVYFDPTAPYPDTQPICEGQGIR
jgi:prepilin-type processing-associated H-X9-DG protein